MTHWREILLVLALAGCATVPPLPPGALCPGADCPRNAVLDWSLHGRISLTHEGQGWHAGLDWENHTDRYRLQVTGPLGQGALRLDGDASGVRLIDADGKVHEATDPEQLLYQVSGWRLPVSGLRYWVRGVPDPANPPLVDLDQDGRLRRIVQSGWTIQYQRFQQVDGIEWPDRMLLQRDDLTLKLVIDRWQPGTVPAL